VTAEAGRRARALALLQAGCAPPGGTSRARKNVAASIADSGAAPWTNGDPAAEVEPCVTRVAGGSGNEAGKSAGSGRSTPAAAHSLAVLAPSSRVTTRTSAAAASARATSATTTRGAPAHARGVA
jgi:hypothetical protein